MPSQVKLTIMVLLLNLVMCIATGCWNNQDLSETSIAAAMGLDKAEDNKIELTVQLVNPSALKSAQKGGGSGNKAALTLSKTGDTVFEANRNLLSTASNKILHNHIQIIVIGETLARDGLTQILDFLERGNQTNRKADILIAKGTTARKILNLQSELETIPAINLADTIDNEDSIGKIKKIMFTDLMKELATPGKDAAIGGVEIMNDKEQPFIKDIRIEGAAAFKKDKLAFWLNPVQTRGLLFMKDKISSAVINVANPLDRRTKVAIEVISSKAKTSVELKDGSPVFNIEINEQGDIVEQQGGGDLSSPEVVEKLKKETERAIADEVKNSIELALDNQCDLMGFGDILHKKHPQYWNKVKENWDEELSRVQFNIKVSSNIGRAGLVKTSVLPK
ncbi:Ger(x)C family spore germination protein [Syntrophomonas curvata]